ncbi:MAG: hypothetical protein DLM59_20115 [Pseudonocardiales bacterium]|nr:MAG: hypothetical protein DLM59_20115 [Pseudonocardiales bacterium]
MYEYSKTAVALCPAGTDVIGGGGPVNGAQHVVIAEDQVGTNQSWAVQAYAACSSPVAGLQIVSVTGDAGSSGFQAKRADCPAGKSALGAGGRINNGAGQVALNTQGPGASISQATAASGLEDHDGFEGQLDLAAVTGAW